ncbi:MAG: hypothetical protein IPO41_11280 [Acidobacteria bacterium]|nr:hypothetical protein [Acidobacteriota bacterium]
MDERVTEQILLKLDEISDVLRDISGKLDNVDGVYGLDEIANRIDEAVDKVVGPTAYDLTDIHNDLTSIDSSLFDLSLKD